MQKSSLFAKKVNAHDIERIVILTIGMANDCDFEYRIDSARTRSKKVDPLKYDINLLSETAGH